MSSRRSILLALLAALAAACASAPAHPAGPIPVEVDHRVRVTLSSRVAPGPLQGTVVSVSPDTLVVAREEGGVRRLFRSQVDAIEVSVDRKRDPVKAARYGLLAGAPLLVLLVLFAAPASENSSFWLVLGPVAGLAAVGAAIGSGTQDVWVDAVWPMSINPAAQPSDSIPAEGH